MTRLERKNLKVRILRLIDLKCTGSPAELAEKLGISVRSIKRYVSEIRNDGHFIVYCHVRRTYVNGLEYI